MKKNNTDIVIIGSGILGLSTALTLIQTDPNLTIRIIGNINKSGGASRAAAAMLGCYGEITENHDSSPYIREKFRCSLEAKSLWGKWIENINTYNTEKLKIRKGTHIIHNSLSGAIDTRNYRVVKEALIENQEPHEEVNFEDIPGINTLDNFRALDALYLPEEGSICSVSVLDSIKKALQTYETIHFEPTEVKNLLIKNGKIEKALLENGESIEGQQFVLAAGAYSQNILDQLPDLARSIPRILSGVGQALVISSANTNCKVDSVIRTPNRAGACGLHMVPYGDNIYVGATNELKIDPEDKPSVGMIHFVLQCVMDQLNQNLFSEKILDIKTGNRPSPMDGFPLLGQCSVDNLFILTGTYRDGFHQSPFLAQEASQSILTGSPMLEGMFNPERRPIKTMTREEAVSEAVEHQMATAYEAGAILPHAFWTDTMKSNIKRGYTSFLSKV
jgi:glycine oxidase